MANLEVRSVDGLAGTAIPYAYAVKAGQWLFLTGKLIYIRRVAGELFSVALDKQTHTERLIVCDKWGKIRGTFHWNKLNEITELKLLAHKLLAETEPPPAEAAGERETTAP